jgi:predicted nuclease of restriction endonuclease-like (RecB) superfamily
MTKITSSPPLDAAIQHIVTLVEQARDRSFRAANTELVNLYGSVGQYLSRQCQHEGWGQGTVKTLGQLLQIRQPGLKGFSAQNLWRMRQFFEAYDGDEELSTLLRALPWSANLHLLSKCKARQERAFYVAHMRQEGWTVRQLAQQIDSALFERLATTPAKLSTALRVLHPSAGQVFKDTYLVDFLGLPADHKESDLQRGLVAKLKLVLTELGRDFCFVGEQFRLQVGMKDFYLDLLFFHRGMNGLVAIELKAEDFQPAHLGQLEFYLEALDRDHRKPHENPTIGVLLCKDRDHEVVEYALSRSLSPALVAQYTTQLQPTKLLLQAKLAELFEQELDARERLARRGVLLGESDDE